MPYIATPEIVDVQSNTTRSYYYRLFACVGTKNGFMEELLKKKKPNKSKRPIRNKNFSTVEEILRESFYDRNDADGRFSFLLPTQVISCEDSNSVIFFYVLPIELKLTLQSSMDQTTKEKMKEQIENFYTGYEKVRDGLDTIRPFWNYIYWNLSPYSIVKVEYPVPNYNDNLDLKYMSVLFTPETLSIAKKSFQGQGTGGVGLQMKGRCFSQYFWRRKLNIDLNQNLNLTESFDQAWDKAKKDEWDDKSDSDVDLNEFGDERTETTTDLGWEKRMKERSYKFLLVYRKYLAKKRKKKREQEARSKAALQVRLSRMAREKEENDQEKFEVNMIDNATKTLNIIKENLKTKFYTSKSKIQKKNKKVNPNYVRKKIKSWRLEYFELVVLKAIKFRDWPFNDSDIEYGDKLKDFFYGNYLPFFDGDTITVSWGSGQRAIVGINGMPNIYKPFRTFKNIKFSAKQKALFQKLQEGDDVEGLQSYYNFNSGKVSPNPRHLFTFYVIW